MPLEKFYLAVLGKRQPNGAFVMGDSQIVSESEAMQIAQRFELKHNCGPHGVSPNGELQVQVPESVYISLLKQGKEDKNV